MSWDYDDQLNRFIFSENDYEEEHYDNECPECGSHNVKIKKNYENSDRDGNRGIWVESLTCNDCGYDEY